MGARERRFTGTVGAEAQDDELFENDVGHGEESTGKESPAEFAVDFFEGFAFEPLGESKDGPAESGEESESDENVGEMKPKLLHKVIIA